MKAGFCAILGRPNVGKSTFLNRVCGRKLAAVSARPQTTRHRILGILTEEDSQIVFVDTPGIIDPSYELQRVIVSSSFHSLSGSDVAMVMVEPGEMEDGIIKKIRDIPILVVINKIDLIGENESISDIIEEYKALSGVESVYAISALRGKGVNRLLEGIREFLPEGEPLYPADIVSDRDERFFCSEIIREKIFSLYGQEVPYTAAVVIDEFLERERGKTFIKAMIYVDKESVKGIIIGKDGEKLKKVGSLARKEIEYFIGRSVYLDLWVKVRKGWRKNINDIREFGYVG